MARDGEYVDIRFFIEGVEVDLGSAQISETLGGASNATIMVPYHGSAMRIPPRSLVHVFYRDPDHVDFRRQSTRIRSPEDYRHTFQNGLGPNLNFYEQDSPSRYKLLFWGETSSKAVHQSTASNQVAFGCLGFTNCLDSIKQVQALRGRGTFSDQELHLAGVDASLAGQRQVERLRDSLEQPRGGTRTVTASGRYATADRILQYMRDAGGDIQSGLRALISGLVDKTNQFWRSRYTQLRIRDMLRAVEEDDTSARLMDLDVFRKFLRNRVGGLGYQFTVRSVIQLLSSFIFHDFVEHMQPSYFPALSQEGQDRLQHAEVRPNERAIDRETQADLVTSWVFKPELWWTAPPACNIVFPNQYKTLSFSEAELMEPTRTLLKVQPGVSGDRRTIADDYFAPDLESLNELALGVPEADQDRFLLPHEKFRGPVTNVILINELARLVTREEAQNYLRSYAQFQHWRSVFGNHGVSIVSDRILPQILVGCPALALDPNTSTVPAATNDETNRERIRLFRELELLRRALRLLQVRLSRQRYLLRLLYNQVYYFSWLAGNADTFPIVIINGVSKLDIGAASLTLTSLGVNQPDPEASLVEAAGYLRETAPSPSAVMSARGPNNSPTGDLSSSRGGTVGYSHVSGQSVDAETQQDRPQITNRDYPPANAEVIESLWGDAAAGLTPDSSGRITTMPEHIQPQALALVEEAISIEASILARVRELEDYIERVQSAIEEILDLLRGTYLLDEDLRHILFYVTGKTIRIEVTESAGVMSTQIQGAFARQHDADIDLDGQKGDSFEGIIQTGSGGFLSEIYSPGRIGPDFYQPLYGVRSLNEVAEEVQQTLLPEDDGAQEFPTGPSWQDLIDEVYAYLNETQDEIALGEGVGVRESAEAVADFYRSLYQLGNVDIESLTAALTARPIATLPQIMGDLIADPAAEDTNYLGAGREGLEHGVGFHQFAFVDEDGEFDLSGFDEGESESSREVAEIRRERVLQYKQALLGERR